MSLFKLSIREQADFARNLSTLTKGGLTLNESLRLIIAESDSRRVRALVARILKPVEEGTSLGNALETEQEIFSDIFIRIVKVGEASGTLEENLKFLSELLERNADLRSKMQSAFLYPEIVVSATILLGFSLAIFILPRLTPLFTSLSIELPLPTKILLAVTGFLQTKLLLLIVGIALGIVLIFLSLRVEFIKRLYHWVFLHLPFLGRLLRVYHLAIIARVFFTSIRSGTGILDVLANGMESTTNMLYRDALYRVSGRVVKGVPLTQAFSQDVGHLFPKNFVTLIAIGERSGTLEGVCAELADRYHEEVDRKIKRLPTIVEPLLLIFIGLMVGFVAVSIILPIYQLTQGLQPK